MCAGNKQKSAHLWALKGAQERLELVHGDLLTEGSYDAAVAGCEGVFHTATSMAIVHSDPKVIVSSCASPLLRESLWWRQGFPRLCGHAIKVDVCVCNLDQCPGSFWAHPQRDHVDFSCHGHGLRTVDHDHKKLNHNFLIGVGHLYVVFKSIYTYF